MISIFFITIADIAIFYFFFGPAVVRHIVPGRMRVRMGLKEFRRHLSHMLKRDRDLLTEQQMTDIRQRADEIEAVRQGGDEEKAAALYEQLLAENEKGKAASETDAQGNRERSATKAGEKRKGQGRRKQAKTKEATEVERTPRRAGKLPFPLSWIGDNLEVLIVTLGIAFGFRALFLQPFKIPTGSMMPTMYGIHFMESDSSQQAGPLRRAFGFLNYSRRYVDDVVEEGGLLDYRSVTTAPPRVRIPGVSAIENWLFPTSFVKVGDERFRLPGKRDKVTQYLGLDYRGSGPRMLAKGDTLARGWLELGDHLFVDRTYLAFHEPKRGDVTVFVTDGIKRMDGSDLGARGRFYIKRLVGLPGDELRITDHKLYIKPSGEAEFALADERFAPAFKRMYSFKGGYRGYCHLGGQHLTTNDAVYKVPENHYFMLGDNSEGSLDSRFWGSVPRANLVGRALFVWWPFTRQWGIIDKNPPLDHDTPPNIP